MPFTGMSRLKTSTEGIEMEMENIEQNTETPAQAYQNWSTNPTTLGAKIMLDKHPELASTYRARVQIMQDNAENPNGPQVAIPIFDAVWIGILRTTEAQANGVSMDRAKANAIETSAEPQR